jgi:hypothetical protein
MVIGLNGWMATRDERETSGPSSFTIEKRKDGDWGTIIDSCLFVHV